MVHEPHCLTWLRSISSHLYPSSPYLLVVLPAYVMRMLSTYHPLVPHMEVIWWQVKSWMGTWITYHHTTAT